MTDPTKKEERRGETFLKALRERKSSVTPAGQRHRYSSWPSHSFKCQWYMRLADALGRGITIVKPERGGKKRRRNFPLQIFLLHCLFLSALVSPSVKHVMDLILLAGAVCLYGTGRSTDTCKAASHAVGTAPHWGGEWKGSAGAHVCFAYLSCGLTTTKSPSAICQ